ncbi:MAG: hypothetical protein HUJ68_04200 [Clostridia bacterium]|nr:hypothetical protein [Clostridia bacterium]
MNLGIDSNIGDYKVGDHIFAAEFGVFSEDEKPTFKILEYEIKKIIKSTVDGVDKSYAEIIDIKFPKVVIKSNLKSGFFKSGKEAAEEFISSMEYICTEAKKVYNEQFN